MNVLDLCANITMYKIYIAVVLVATVCAQENNLEDIDSWIAQILGKKDLGQDSSPAVDNKHEASTIVLPINLNPNHNVKDIKCTMESGEQGVCVRYFLCNANDSVIKDGSGLFDLRSSSSDCTSFLDTCCRISDTRQSNIPSTPEPDVQPRHEGCGWINPEGIGFKTTGDNDGKAKFGEIPWMVAILKLKPVNESEPNGPKFNFYVGGGSLIHPKAVLTAAYNVYQPNALKIRAGEWDTQTNDEIYPHQDRDVSHVEVHKDFNEKNLFYDIAVVFLTSPIDTAPNVGWACLPPPQKVMMRGTRCITTGWGKDKFGTEGHYQAILKKLEVPVVGKRQCQKQLRQTRLGPFFELHHSFMCAGGETGKGTCEGDGGSPLICPIEEEPGRYHLSGIVAWRLGCGVTGTPDVYVDVGRFYDWIKDKITGQGLDTKYFFP